MKRSSNSGGMGVQPPPDIQITEHRKPGLVTTVIEPLLQTALLALAFSVAAGATLIAPVILGPRVFYFCTGIAALAAFIWSLVFEVKWQDRVTLPLLVGAIALCFWAFADGIGFSVEHSPFLSVAFLVLLCFLWGVAFWLFVSFGQELIQRSAFQEKHFWAGLREFLTWRYKTAPPPTKRDHFVKVRDNSNRVRMSGDAARVMQEVLDSDYTGELDDVINDGGYRDLVDLMEFLVRGQTLLVNGEPIRYSRRKWKGLKLTSGTIVSETRARNWAQELQDLGMLADSDNGLDVVPDISMSELLRRFSVEFDVSAPPDRIREWSRVGEYSHPTPAQPIPPQVIGGAE